MSNFPITSTSQYINLDAIKSACQMIKDAANDYKNSAKEIDAAIGCLGKNALSIDGETYEKLLTELKETFESSQTQLESLADQILAEATKILENQKIAYQNYLNYLEYLKEQEAQNG